jgi:hypothetical protein
MEIRLTMPVPARALKMRPACACEPFVLMYRVAHLYDRKYSQSSRILKDLPGNHTIKPVVSVINKILDYKVG